MGTRNVTIVKMDGDIALTKYCQWDGYPTGQGVDLLEYINKHMDLRKLKKGIRNCEILSEEKAEEIFDKYLEAKQKLPKPKKFDDRLEAENKLRNEMVVGITRDTGGGPLLGFIQHRNGVQLVDSKKGDLNYAKGKDEFSFGCEYCYEVDLDSKTVSIYEGHYLPKNLVKKLTFRTIRAKSFEQLEKDMKQLEDKIYERYDD